MTNRVSRADEKRGRTRSPANAFQASLEKKVVRRNQRTLRNLLGFVPSIAAAILLEVLVYAVVFFQSDRLDFHNLLAVSATIACVPILVALMLLAFRRQNSPISSALFVTGIAFSFAVSFLAGLRIPVSFVGLGFSIPLVVVIMALANVRFHRALTASVAVCAFPDQDVLKELLGDEIGVIEDPTTDIGDVDTLLIDSAVHHREEWSALLTRCYMNGIDVLPWTKFMEIRLGRVDARSLDVSQIMYSPSQMFYLRFKRIIDLVLIVVTLPISLVLAALVALYILILDGQPVLFTQLRSGYGGRPFRIYKFRTMYRKSSGEPAKIKDQRILPGCKLIRKVRFDEIPQLFNILRGDMTLIGPRPEVVSLYNKYKKELPEYSHRTLLVPGLTGWAQVNSGYAADSKETSIKLSYDLYYLKHLSLDLDILIVLRTIRTVIFGSGAR